MLKTFTMELQCVDAWTDQCLSYLQVTGSGDCIKLLDRDAGEKPKKNEEPKRETFDLKTCGDRVMGFDFVLLDAGRLDRATTSINFEIVEAKTQGLREINGVHMMCRFVILRVRNIKLITI